MNDDVAGKIECLERFKDDILAYHHGTGDANTRARINRSMRRVKELVAEAGAYKAITLSPPPAIGGLIVRNGDPFSFILQDYYGMSTAPAVADMVEEAIGYFESPTYKPPTAIAPKDATKLAAGSVEPREHLARAGRPTPDTGPKLPEKITLLWLCVTCQCPSGSGWAAE